MSELEVVEMKVWAAGAWPFATLTIRSTRKELVVWDSLRPVMPLEEEMLLSETLVIALLSIQTDLIADKMLELVLALML